MGNVLFSDALQVNCPILPTKRLKRCERKVRGFFLLGVIEWWHDSARQRADMGIGPYKEGRRWYWRRDQGPALQPLTIDFVGRGFTPAAVERDARAPAPTEWV